MPTVLNQRHIGNIRRGQAFSDGRNAVFVGRPSKWGNPFVIGKDGDRATVVEKYRRWLRRQPELLSVLKTELAGKDLVCHCAPAACHADVLLELANE